MLPVAFEVQNSATTLISIVTNTMNNVIYLPVTMMPC